MIPTLRINEIGAVENGFICSFFGGIFEQSYRILRQQRSFDSLNCTN